MPSLDPPLNGGAHRLGYIDRVGSIRLEETAVDEARAGGEVPLVEEQRKRVRLEPEEERLLAKVLTHKLVEGARGGEVRPRQDHLDALGNSTLAGRVAQPLLGGLAVARKDVKPHLLVHLRLRRVE